MALQLALVGCGGMGLRHALGYTEYRRVLGERSGGLRLAAVCGRQGNAASYIADRVEQETGGRPAVYADFEAMLAGERSLEAVDIVTSTPAHHVLALRAMEAGLHVMTEKPMGLTLKACRLMRDRATREGKILAVAENFRRDPMNRLTRALIAAGAIGRPYFALDMQIRSARRGVMHGTVWRAKRDHAGGMVLEVGVHNADMLLYLLGAVTRVSAETSTYERFRPLTDIRTQSPTLAPFYAHRSETTAARGALIEHDAIDTAFAVMRFASGATGQLALTDASHDGQVGQSSIHGADGTIVRSPSRSGKSPLLVRDGKEISGEQLLALVPDFVQDEPTAILWGGQDRLGAYRMEFAEIDRKLIALEYEDFISAVRAGKQPEVGWKEGMEALALAYAIVEAGELGHAVSVDDVLEGRVDAYQSVIDQSFAI